VKKKIIIGICGLNQDAYNDLTYGRIRRLYVLKSHRESGIARMLVEAVIRQANGKFEKLILRTIQLQENSMNFSGLK
jgi:GNAT superfamily N-acetyltransferase